jgi:hypothetical protein
MSFVFTWSVDGPHDMPVCPTYDNEPQLMYSWSPFW